MFKTSFSHNSTNFLLFNGKKIDLLKFYFRIHNSESIKEFLKNYPQGEIKIYKYLGDETNETVFVIPTSDSNNSYARYLRNHLNKENIVFAESSGPQFNYSKSVNKGIMEALKIGPDKIIICNDDIEFIDSIEVLKKEINENADVSAMTPNQYLGRNFYHGEIFSVFENRTKTSSVFDEVKYRAHLKFKNALTYSFLIPLLLKDIKYRVKIEPLSYKTNLSFLYRLVNFSDFGIFDASIFKKMKFEETYINGCEDYDFVLRLNKLGIIIKKIRPVIKSLGGASLKHTNERELRNLLNEVTLSNRINELIA